MSSNKLDKINYDAIPNYHTHTIMCDGKDTARAMVEQAIKLGMSALGFSGHGYTPFDLCYCLKDENEYRNEITALKVEYQDKLQIYLGIEEDILSPVQREKYDYIIGSSHYVVLNGEYITLDASRETFLHALDCVGGDIVELGNIYYNGFCEYLESRKPDIIGHFDLITKFCDVVDNKIFNDGRYDKVASDYVERAINVGAIFEVNTGAMARGLRNSPYPSKNLLQLIKNKNGKIMLSSDCHDLTKLNYRFAETIAYLKSLGFNFAYALLDGEFKSYDF